MNVKYAKAILNENKVTQEIVHYIQFENLYVCAERIDGSGDFSGYLVYDQNDFVDGLKELGFEVNESEILLQINDSSFNELELAYYKLQSCELYIFKDIAIKVGYDGLETYCKENINIIDVAEKWKLEIELRDRTPVVEYSIPKNKVGELAIKMDKTYYELWDEHYRYSGEVLDSEERLQCATIYYAKLSNGADFDIQMNRFGELVNELIEDYNVRLQSCSEDCKNFYNGKIEHAKNLLNTANGIIDEINTMRRK